ncbi:FmdE family protein [Pelotomaculum terephthalicicum JT]|uniref:FmdE family protein n=1 Tax=Pelotomaculum TaxID=191373 RepID=UPI0009D4041A|nr:MULTISPECIES: FmdE family protein [Pelotomaculum]MCG9969139.1 FmdE family protein [Pelotomaculum terephthalicicum JT]OPX90124.1 MAG: FmdE, Molybdenum formylmethanofuran dehydrogenase operon [Pelotomaculum sp. PtaB.Bin117]OPY59314.1 MAG: FmdE, Molybdenum formylmethanofuran dehydrogenase operon [Pelotomaculum sp. PtaU1.Bin065]
MNKKLWEKSVAFHGHECPGLAIGFKACEAAMEKMGIAFSKDEEIVCVTENDACGVDAIQVITGCTLGKGNLLYKGTGKMAFSFFSRSDGNSLRMIAKPFNDEMDRRQRQEYILNSPADEIFNFNKPNFNLPETARMFATVVCEHCGEGVPEHKIRMNDGKKVCLDCFKDYSRGW